MEATSRESVLDRLDPAVTAFFLDVDGTLLGFKDDPLDVVADASLLRTLQRLRDFASGAVALVSGRTVPDLDRIMAPMIFAAGGIHGADLRFADGQRRAVAADSLDHVRGAIGGYVTAHPGLRIEDKSAAIAVHYRRVPQLGEELCAFLARVVTQPDLKLQRGKMVVEVKPSSADKGTAIAALMRTLPFAGRMPLFIGDDVTDEHGFEAVNAMGGISIKVGDLETATLARYRLASHQVAVAWLAGISKQQVVG